MQLQTIKALIQDQLTEVESLLDQQLDSPVSLIKEIGTHLIHSGGKRIRPMLVILVNKAYGCDGNADVLLGAAIELIHAATLLHDDVVDNSEMRRAQRTANAIWDNAASVLVGDFLYSRAFQLIVSIEDISTLKMLAEATNMIAMGEVLQLQNRHNSEIQEADYLNILLYKTGTLFSAATQAGAILAYRPAAEIKLMRQFGETLGIAFQLVDDMLDYTADEKVLGKKLGDDLAEGKITMPLLHAMKQAPQMEDRQFISQMILEGQREALPRLQQIIHDAGSLNYTISLAQRYVKQAQDCLTVLPDTPFKEALYSLTDLVIQRDS